MFLSSCLLLLPIILATEVKFKNNNYVITIEKKVVNTLKNIEVIGDPSKELDLSGLTLHEINKNAFDNVSHVKILDLSNNALTRLWEDAFAKLMNLEKLVLSQNIKTLMKPYDGLMRHGYSFGLTKPCDILAKCDPNSATITDLCQYVLYDYSTQIKICINDTKLMSAEHYTKDEKLASGCSIRTLEANRILSLNSLGIAEFQKGWYKLRDSTLNHIDLRGNLITRLTSAMLNDLPEIIIIVDLSNNNIKHLEKDIIVNKHLREMFFMSNSIIEIEDDVFINTNLTNLILSNNQLTDTTFAATLPPTLKNIELRLNRIVEISGKSFSKLNQLEALDLDENYIMDTHRDSLRGLTGLKYLRLGHNNLKNIKAGFFKGVTALEFLHLESNFIANLELSVFADLKNIKSIFLSSNGLSKLTRNSLIDLPDSLEVLDLQNNTLRDVKAGIFVNSPKYELLLNNNKISSIEDGSFNLPDLLKLSLNNNLLSVLDSEKFRGLKYLLYLQLRGNNITTIKKGTFKNLVHLCDLDASENFFSKLEIGALPTLVRKGCYMPVD